MMRGPEAVVPLPDMADADPRRRGERLYQLRRFRLGAVICDNDFEFPVDLGQVTPQTLG